MENKNNVNSTLFRVTRVITLIIGILASITIIGLIIGIPLLIASSYYRDLAIMSDQQVKQEADKVLIWGIVLVIIIFPLGVIPLIASFNLDGQLFGNDSKYKQTESYDKPSSDDKIEKIKKLHDLKEQGVITEEEFKLAKEKLLNEQF